MSIGGNKKKTGCSEKITKYNLHSNFRCDYVCRIKHTLFEIKFQIQWFIITFEIKIFFLRIYSWIETIWILNMYLTICTHSVPNLSNTNTFLWKGEWTHNCLSMARCLYSFMFKYIINNIIMSSFCGKRYIMENFILITLK